ncbi:MAG: hypothetical protein WBO45_00440, partial [Planctomycetota bacterium]
MLRWLLVRLGQAAVTLLAVTFVTFLLVDQAPLDRAELAVLQAEERAFPDAAARDAAIRQLRIRYGALDPETGERVPGWLRYGTWLANAATGRFGGAGDDHGALLRRLRQALPVT